MKPSTPEAERISRLCWEAVGAAALNDGIEVGRTLRSLRSMTPEGKAIRLAATGWAGIIADHIVGSGPGGSFASTIENADEATEIFAAVVCAVGNRDVAGALSVLRDGDPAATYEAIMHLLRTAGAVVAQADGVPPRRI